MGASIFNDRKGSFFNKFQLKNDQAGLFTTLHRPSAVSVGLQTQISYSQGAVLSIRYTLKSPVLKEPSINSFLKQKGHEMHYSQTRKIINVLDKNISIY